PRSVRGRRPSSRASASTTRATPPWDGSRSGDERSRRDATPGSVPLPEATAPSPPAAGAAPGGLARLRRHRPPAPPFGLSALCVGYRRETNAHKLRLYDRFHLPGYDPWVYMAMAEGPGFFTVAPWGYRVLPPWLAHVAALAPWRGTGDEVRGFRRVGFVSVAVAGALLFQWLRRLRRSQPLALGAVVFFALSTPVDEVVRVPFLAEPVGIVLTLALLLTLDAGRTLPLLPAAL